MPRRHVAGVAPPGQHDLVGATLQRQHRNLGVLDRALRHDGEQDRLPARKNLGPPMGPFASVRVRRRQPLGLAATRGHPPEATAGVVGRKDNRVIGPPARATRISTVHLGNRDGWPAADRHPLQRAGTVEEPHPVAVRREKGVVRQGAQPRERRRLELVQRPHIEALLPVTHARIHHVRAVRGDRHVHAPAIEAQRLPGWKRQHRARDLAAVLNTEPDWAALPTETPAAIHTLLRRCLAKERRRRVPDIGMARLEIDDALTGPATEGASAVAVPPLQVWQRPMLLAAGMLLLLLVIGLAVWTAVRPGPPLPRPAHPALPDHSGRGACHPRRPRAAAAGRPCAPGAGA